LRAKHNIEGNKFIGIEGNTGKITDMAEANVWEPVAVKLQVYKTAIESSCMLLRIDDVVSGLTKQKVAKGGASVTDGQGNDIPETVKREFTKINKKQKYPTNSFKYLFLT